jgi:hypothetical protein
MVLTALHPNLGPRVSIVGHQGKLIGRFRVHDALWGR